MRSILVAFGEGSGYVFNLARRRFSVRWQEEVLQVCKERLGDVLTGTSNVMLAMRYGLRPLGTMAHEYLQAC